MSSFCPRKDDVRVWCGYCYANARGRSAYVGHSGFRGRRQLEVETLAMALKKREKEEGSSGGPLKAIAGKWGKDYPTLWEFLTATTYENGEKRVPATLTVFVDGAGVKLCLNDRDQSLTGWSCAETVEGAFLALEKALREDRVEWKSSQSSGKRRK